MFPQRLLNEIVQKNIRKLITGSSFCAKNDFQINIKQESERMKKFHEKLRNEEPGIESFNRFNDLVIIDVDPKSGEFMPESEKEPTKWGDWQHGGRVSDF